MSYSWRDASGVIAQTVPVDLIDDDGDPLPGAAELVYDPVDPYAVTVTFLGEETNVSWTFGRDLLVDGTYRPAGHGDVRLSPCLDIEGRATVMLELHAGGAVGVVQIRTGDLHSFLDRTTDAVRPGAESHHLDVDASLAEILVAHRGE